MSRYGGGWKTGMTSWNRAQEKRNWMNYWPGQWKIVTLEIEGVIYKFRVDSNDVIFWVIEPKGQSAPYWAVGQTVSQFTQTAESPLPITDPILHPPGEYQLSTTLGVLVPEKFKSISPAAYSYFEKLAQRWAEYMTAIYDDFGAMDAIQMANLDPFQEFAVGLMSSGPNTNILPFSLAQMFIMYAPENMMLTDANLDAFFKDLSQEVYERAPETSYEELFAAYHDAEVLKNEELRGTLRQAEIRDMHSTMISKVTTDPATMEEQRRVLTEELISGMITELTEARRHASETGNETAVRRMEDLAERIDMFTDESSSAHTLEKMITMEPNFSVEIRQSVMRLYNVTTFNRLESREVLDQDKYSLSVKDVTRIDEAKRLADSTKERYQTESSALIRQLEAEGNPSWDSAVNQLYPHLSENWQMAARNTQFGVPEFGIKTADQQHRDRMYGVRKPAQKGLKIAGEMFDKTGMLVKGLRPASKKFKVSRPDRAWRRKLSQGVVDIKLTIKNFRERETTAINMAVMEHLMRRFGGDAKSFDKLKKAMEKGVDVANDVAFKTMLPTFVEMVHQETGHFMGMDKLAAGKRGVFFEFVPPTLSDIKINKRKPYNAHINLRWARINTSRSLAFYKDKQGQPAGERRRRVEQSQSAMDAYKARPTAGRARRAFGVGIGAQKEQRGQDFIIQKYLDRRKRTFLEGMDKRQLSQVGRAEISEMFGDEAGAIVRKAVRSGESVTLSLAQHLRAKPGDRIHVFMNDSGQIGTTITRRTTEYTPGTATPSPKPQPFIAKPAGYKKITTLNVAAWQQTEPQEPVSDSFRGALRAIAAGGYSGNIFQRLANILWNIDVPLPDWNMEEIALSESQIGQATTWLRDRSSEINTKLNQGVAEERSTKKIEDRVIGPAVKQIVDKAAKLSSTSEVLYNIFNRTFPNAIDKEYIVGLTA